MIKGHTSKSRFGTDNFLLLAISGFISLGLLPFAVFRLFQQDWNIAIMNTVLVAGTIFLFFHLLLTKRPHLARVGLAVLMILAMTGTIFFKGVDNILWVYPALTTTFFLLSPGVAAILSLTFLFIVIGMIWSQINLLFLLTFSISALATFLFSFAFSNRMHNQAIFLEQLATTDPLTGVGNRRKLEEKLLEIVNRIKRTPSNVCSLIIFDLDYFKQVNDVHGHSCGDNVLQRFAIVISSLIRESDSFYRLGGEEFVLVLENTQLVEANLLAEKLASEIEQTEWRLPDMNITTSAGIAQYINNESSYDWLQRADDALYLAKSSGRNRCVMSNDSFEAS